MYTFGVDENLCCGFSRGWNPVKSLDAVTYLIFVKPCVYFFKMLSQPLLFMPQFHGSPFLCTISQMSPIKVEVQLVLIFRGHPVPTASFSSFFVLCWSQPAIKSITATYYTEYVATIYDCIICILLIYYYYFNFESHGHNYKYIPTPLC